MSQAEIVAGNQTVIVEAELQEERNETCEQKIEAGKPSSNEIQYVQYKSELQMPDIMRLMKVDLSEPYSIYTYRYFIHKWPHLCFLAECDGKCVGAIVCKLEAHQSNRRHEPVNRGYIAMLAVDKNYRKRKIGSTLVKMVIQRMAGDGCDEVVLETEVTNTAALGLYENLGFIRDKYLYQYYLNGENAYRLKLWLTDTTCVIRRLS